MSATVEMLRAGDRVLVHGPDGTLDAVIVQVADYASSVVVDMLLNGQPARRSVPAGLVRAVEIGSEGQRWPRITEQNAAQFEPPKLRPFNTAEKRLRGWPPWRWFWQMTGSDWQRDSSSYESQVRRWKHLVDREHKSWALSLSSSDEHAALLERWCACGDERIFRAAVRRTPADVELRVVLKKEASRAVVDGLVEHGVLPGEWRSFAFDTAEWRAFCEGASRIVDSTQQGARTDLQPSPAGTLQLEAAAAGASDAPLAAISPPALAAPAAAVRTPRDTYTCAGVTLKPPSHWTSLADVLPALKASPSPEGESRDEQLQRLQLPDLSWDEVLAELGDSPVDGPYKCFLFALRCCVEGLTEYEGIPFRPDKWRFNSSEIDYSIEVNHISNRQETELSTTLRWRESNGWRRWGSTTSLYVWGRTHQILLFQCATTSRHA